MEQIEKTIKQNSLIDKKDKIVIGVSGGPDSMCLLHFLNAKKDEYQIEIFVAHINHKIREEADSDEEYVKNYCEKYKIPVFVIRIDIKKYAKEKKCGEEEAGRIARYEFFDEVLNKTGSNKIATAHNNNDKVETVIMNIIRGSGIRGLIGIEAIRDKKYIRPLIDCKREDIENYCNSNKLNPRIDKTNTENIYARNKIRNVVIPYIKQEFNPSIISAVTKLSNIAKEEDEYINKITEIEYTKIQEKTDKNTIVLDLKMFNKEEQIIKSRIILLSFEKLGVSKNEIEKTNIEDIIKMCEKNIGNKYLIPKKGTKVAVKSGQIIITGTD
ncbi:MAG: tRNA lysidine(34) synthetase TilS [Lachnospiraceae bacterium]|nr:tRNA lysidine(34) synthetase TilS [Lachnospiraceae bacterium]